MATEQVLPFSAISVVEDVLQQNGGRLSDVDFASRQAEEASLRRNEAAGWLRKKVGVVAGKDLPAEPSEEAFRIGLRSGIILCNVLNKIEPGSVPKVVEGSCDSVLVPDGAALAVFQYFENVRNFLAAMEQMGLPTFEASDLERGGNSSRIVNCVLALKAYSEWKQEGSVGSWKYGGLENSKANYFVKPLLRKNSEPFTKSFMNMSSEDKDGYLSDHQSSCGDPGLDRMEGGPLPSLHALVRDYLSDKKPDEIPMVVESMLSKVMEEFERLMHIQHETSLQIQPETGMQVQPETGLQVQPETGMQVQPETGTQPETTEEDKPSSKVECSMSETTDMDEEMEGKEDAQDLQDKQNECSDEKYNDQEESSNQILKHQQLEESFQILKQQQLEASTKIVKQQSLVQQQNRSVQELKTVIHQTKSGMHLLQKKYEEEIINMSKHLHGLASAAAGYHKVVDENRKLYNQIMDLKGNIRVYCRVRPSFKGTLSHQSPVSNIEEGSITIVTSSKNGKDAKKLFNFNRAFGPAATQSEVFSDTQPLIRSVLDGFNVCIFAYGQTGSGKTHTMSGPDNPTEETLGVNYRALGDLFYLSDQRKDTITYDISVQMLEIYNEQVRDLLATDGAKRLEIRNSSNNGINVPEANLVRVSSTADVINLMNLGHKNRATGATAMNDRSSRSHSCLTVHIHGKYLTSGNSLRGCMHLVDLAGSERADKTEATGDRLKEAQHINKSLAALGDVISSLASKSAHVPYRNSKLTQLLQDSLGGQAKTLMFVHISPEPDALGETLSTLKFAERVSMVELGAAKVNKDSTKDNADVKELKEQIASLKAALARKDGESENSLQNINGSNEKLKLKSSASNPVLQRNMTYGGRKLPKEDDSSSVEGKKKDATKLKRRSLDPQDMCRSSPPWPQAGSLTDDKESVSGDSVDTKIFMSRNNSLTSDDSLVAQWEAESKQFSPMLSPSSFSEPSKASPDHHAAMPKKYSSPDYEDLHRPGSEVSTPDEYDELEIATSDSSESSDLIWQSHLPKPAVHSSGLGPKARKSTNARPIIKPPEIRSGIPSLIPMPLKKQIPVSQSKKQPGVSVDVKRRYGNAK